MKGKILTIEDDESILEVIQAYLEASEFEVYGASTGPEGLTQFDRIHPDLVILDLNLPGMDGMEVAARIRKRSDTFILMLTARNEELDRIAGLKIGADDYVSKPFSARELVARVEALLRRSRSLVSSRQPATGSAIIRFQHVTIDLHSYEVVAGGLTLDLTTTEFNLLKALMTHNNQVLSREQLLNLVWGESDFRNDRIVDVYVGQVRRKLEVATGRILITTIRGVGYKFYDDKI
ncbi:MAG: response regulator transcription factor [Chloroflexota bacterium]